MRRIALIALSLMVTACESPFGSEPSLSGRWVGRSTTTDLTLDLTLAETEDGRVQGSGGIEYTYTIFEDTFHLSPSVHVEGAYDHPHVSLVITWGQGAVRHLTGEVGNDRMTGRFCSSGGGCEPVEMSR
jgi:hypothetical protein